MGLGRLAQPALREPAIPASWLSPAWPLSRAANLPASAWEHAAATRGLEPAQRALAHNLARYAPDAL